VLHADDCSFRDMTTSWMSQGTLQPAHALLAAITRSVSRSCTSFSASPIFALINSCGNNWRAHRVCGTIVGYYTAIGNALNAFQVPLPAGAPQPFPE